MSALVAALLVVVPGGSAVATVDQRPSVGWQPNGRVQSITTMGNMIILGGSFTALNLGGTSVPRSHLAALDASTGALLPWNPGADGEVNALAVAPDGSGLYVGGSFGRVAGAARNNLAKVGANGALLPFQANVNGPVQALLPAGSALYVAGNFTRVGGVSRGHGAIVNGSTGAVGAWDPRTNAAIRAMVRAADGGVFVGGNFTQVGGSGRNHLAKVTGAAGDRTPWKPGLSCNDAQNPCNVFDLALAGDTLYAGVGGPGGQVSAMNAATGAERWWTAGDGDVQAVVVDGNRVFAGGHFMQSFGGQPRAGLVALNAATGAVLPDITLRFAGNTGVWTLLRRDSRLLIGGNFTRVGNANLSAYTTLGIVPDAPDVRPPAAPSGLTAPAALPRAVSLIWDPAGDNLGVTSYRILRDGRLIGTSPHAYFRDSSAAAAARYRYTVQAVDARGNVSAPSAAALVTTEPGAPMLLPYGATWRHKSLGPAPRAGWMNPGFTPVGWSVGRGPFGYGDGDETTLLSPLRGLTSYFRTEFSLGDPRLVRAATLRLLVDDGAIVYLNGREIARVGLPGGAVGHDTPANRNVEGAAEHVYQSIPVPVAALRPGTNVVAAQVHNQSMTSPDLSFDAFLTAVTEPAPPAPTGLKGAVRGRSAVLSWQATPRTSSYAVYRNGKEVGTSRKPKYVDFGVTKPNRYRYTVRATGVLTSGPSAAVTLRGKLPALRSRVAVRSAAGRLRIDVTPNLKRYNYRIVVQVKDGGWKTWRRLETLGRKDVVGVNPPKGVYRVKLGTQLGVRKAVSRAVRVPR